MPIGSLLKKNRRLKVLKEDDPEYKQGKTCFMTRDGTYLHPTFCSVKKLFEDGWLHPNKPLPTIRSIFKLLKTEGEMGDYHSYK